MVANKRAPLLHCDLSVAIIVMEYICSTEANSKTLNITELGG